MAPKSLPLRVYARTLSATFSRPSPNIDFYMHFGRLWLPFGIPLAPLGSLLAPFWHPLGSTWVVSAPFWLPFVKFGDLSGRFGLILVTNPIKLVFLVTPLLKIMFCGIDFAKHSQITVCTLHEGKLADR